MQCPIAVAADIHMQAAEVEVAVDIPSEVVVDTVDRGRDSLGPRQDNLA
jgi:hypothetical protein